MPRAAMRGPQAPLDGVVQPFARVLLGLLFTVVGKAIEDLLVWLAEMLLINSRFH